MRHFWRNTLLLMAAAALFLTAALAADGTEEQCPQPTNVRIITEPTVISVTQWDGNVAPMTFYPGSLIWDDMGDAYTYYIEYFRRSDGGDGTYTPIFNSYCSDYYYTLWSVDQAELLTGDYYAEVTAKRVDDTVSPSLPAQTQIWHYTRTAQLDCPTGLAWDGMTATCGAVEGADNYNFCVYFSETEDGEYIWNHINYLSDTPQRDLRDAVDEQGNGYYYFTVVAESDDITVALDSEVSVHSPIYHRDTPQLPMPTGFRVVTEEESITYTMNGETYTDTMYPGYVTWNWDPNATQYTLRVYETGMSYTHSISWAYDAPYCNPMEHGSNWNSGSYTMTLQASDETGVYTASETAALTLDYHPTETLAVPSLSVDGRTATILPNAGNDGKVRDYCIIIRVKTAEIERDFWDYTDGTTYWLPQWYVEQYPGAAFSVAVRARSNDLLQCRDSGNSAFYPLTIPELDTPLDPQWITQSEGAYLTGFIQFTESANTCGRYRIDLFEVGEGLVGTYELDTGGRPGETVPYRDHFYDLSAPASYYFVVTSLPDENSLYAPSLGARSPEWRFDPPQKYTAVTRAAWQGDLATWEYPYGEMQGDGLLVEWLVGPDPDHLIPEQKSFLTFHPDVVTAQMPNRLYSWRDSDCYFAFRVRLYSTRLETAAHGDWVYSEPMHLQASSIQTTQTIDRLNSDNGDLSAIQETLEALPSQHKLDAWQELPEAMRTSVVALEEKVNVQVTVEADTSVQVVGLGLSAVGAAKAVTLTVTQEERTLQLLTAPEMDERNFQNAIDVTFEATNVKDELVIPVQISLPVSTDNPDQLRLYKGDNLDEVPIILADGYVRFAVADLSETYVLAEANLLGEVTVNDKTVTVIAQAPTGTTLYAASYDEGGRMRDVATAPVAEGQISYTLSLTPGTSVRVFLLDDNQMPLCQTKVIEKS